MSTSWPTRIVGEPEEVTAVCRPVLLGYVLNGEEASAIFLTLVLLS